MTAREALCLMAVGRDATGLAVGTCGIAKCKREKSLLNECERDRVRHKSKTANGVKDNLINGHIVRARSSFFYVCIHGPQKLDKFSAVVTYRIAALILPFLISLPAIGTGGITQA